MTHQTDACLMDSIDLKSLLQENRHALPSPTQLLVACDATSMLKLLPDGSVDMIITDPAYESLEKHRAKGTTTRLKESDGSSNAWFPIFHDERYPDFLAEMYRVMRPERHAYLFCDETTADVLKPMAREAGFWVWKEVIWVKTTKTNDGLFDLLRDELDTMLSEAPLPDQGWWKVGTLGLRSLRAILKLLAPSRLADLLVRTGMGYHWRGSCERILFLEKRSTKQTWPRDQPTGKGRQLNFKGWKDVLFGTPPLDKDDYPTEKPAEVIERLILNSSNEGEVIVDPFGGSGVVADVARQLGRGFITSDIHPPALEAMKARLGAR
jgi:DNA modification methylase